MKSILVIFRKLRKNKAANSLAIAGLVAGLVCVMYIFFWVADEISYNRFNEKLDRIFVVHAYLDEGGKKQTFFGCPPAVGPALKNEYPEVETTCRYIPAFANHLVSYEGQKYLESTAISEFSLFDIFSLPFIYGDRGDEGTPNRIVLTETAARKYFGSSNPVGKVVRMDDRYDMIVTGVIRDIPHNSSIAFNAVIPIEYLKMYYSGDGFMTTWYNNSFTTFGLLHNASGFNKIASTITRRIQKEIPESTNYLRAYKFEDFYLYEQNHIRNVRIFILIAILVLTAAMLNFINLSTARSAKQAKETGLRKAIGASRFSMVKLIYSDVTVVCLLAFVSAIIISMAGLPWFNAFVGKTISVKILFSLIPLAVLGVIFVVTVFLSGSYPAFFLSKFSPVQTLSSGFQTVKSRGLFRNSLVVSMFVVSIILLTSTLIVSRQARYLQKMDLGFEKEQLMYISLKGKLVSQADALKEELTRSPGIISATATNFLPTMIGDNGEGWNWQGKSPDFKPLVTNWWTDQDLVKTLGAKMAEGSFFDKDQPGVVINKTFADMIGWDSFTGKTLNAYGSDLPVLGVINDIHFNSLSIATQPMAIRMIGKNSGNYMMLKVASENISKTLNDLKKTCESIEPTFPVEYGFMDDQYNQLLTNETSLKKLVGIFSGFAMLVLCLGLLGVVIFLTEQRTKEIGIRKCLGENVVSISSRLIRPFLISGIVAGLIAMPLTWWFMNRWLEGYAYHISISIWLFLASGLIALSFAALTVFWQSWKAATRNPVEALRYE